MSADDPPQAAVDAAVTVGRALSGTVPDEELARRMLAAAMPHLSGTATATVNNTSATTERAWAPLAPAAHRFRVTGFTRHRGRL